MQDKSRSHVFRHPPPHLGITSFRYGASIVNAHKIEHSVTGGTTGQKTQPVNVMELFYSLIRKQAWTAFHPPPKLIYECRKNRKTHPFNRRGSPGSWGEAFTKTGVRQATGTPADAESLATG